MKLETANYLVAIICGMVLGFSITIVVISAFENEKSAEIIKKYQDGKIECQTVGGEFLCREVRK